MINIVLFGPPGAGKGTLGRSLARHFRVPHVATGDLLRSALAHDRDGAVGQAAQVINAGYMVSDAVANSLVFSRIKESDAEDGWILDGYPRTLGQAEALDGFLQREQQTVTVVITLAVSEETVLERLGGRSVCVRCGASYHETNNPPRVVGICDNCGGELVIRDDDTPSGISRRLRLYHERTVPLADWYKKRGVLQTISGEGEPDDVLTHALRVIEQAGIATGETKETLV